MCGGRHTSRYRADCRVFGAISAECSFCEMGHLACACHPLALIRSVQRRPTESKRKTVFFREAPSRTVCNAKRFKLRML